MKSNTIQAIIIEELLKFEVVEVDGQKVKVGLTYDEVLENVLARAKVHPLIDASKVKTSKNCITWYASHMRNAKDKLYNAKMLEIQVRSRLSTKSTKVATAK